MQSFKFLFIWAATACSQAPIPQQDPNNPNNGSTYPPINNAATGPGTLTPGGTLNPGGTLTPGIGGGGTTPPPNVGGYGQPVTFNVSLNYLDNSNYRNQGAMFVELPAMVDTRELYVAVYQGTSFDLSMQQAMTTAGCVQNTAGYFSGGDACANVSPSDPFAYAKCQEEQKNAPAPAPQPAPTPVQPVPVQPYPVPVQPYPVQPVPVQPTPTYPTPTPGIVSPSTGNDAGCIKQMPGSPVVNERLFNSAAYKNISPTAFSYSVQLPGTGAYTFVLYDKVNNPRTFQMECVGNFAFIGFSNTGEGSQFDVNMEPVLIKQALRACN